MVKPNSVKIGVLYWNGGRKRPCLLAQCYPVSWALENVLAGYRVSEIAERHDLTIAQVRACIRYAIRAVEREGGE